MVKVEKNYLKICINSVIEFYLKEYSIEVKEKIIKDLKKNKLIKKDCEFEIQKILMNRECVG